MGIFRSFLKQKRPSERDAFKHYITRRGPRMRRSSGAAAARAEGASLQSEPLEAKREWSAITRRGAIVLHHPKGRHLVFLPRSARRAEGEVAGDRSPAAAPGKEYEMPHLRVMQHEMPPLPVIAHHSRFASSGSLWRLTRFRREQRVRHSRGAAAVPSG